MLRLNQNLINAKRQAEIQEGKIETLRKQMEAELLALETVSNKVEQEQALNQDWLKGRLENFKKQFAVYFNRTQYKFTADVSKDGEYIETFTQGKVLIGRYGKDANGRFKPIELTVSGINKQEDLDYSSMKPQIYALLESTFK